MGSFIHTASTWVLPVLLAITFHEASHGFVAWKLGDDTAYRLGRVTFNPFRHIDRFGTVILPGLLILFGSPFLFGYAKPVPVNFGRLKRPRRDTALVAAAGPASNIVLALFSAAALNLVAHAPEAIAPWAAISLVNSIRINVMLAIFNMLPLLPLDGGRVLGSLLPAELARPYLRTERFGMLILLALIFLVPMIGMQMGTDLNILRWLLWAPYEYVVKLVLAVTGADSIIHFR
ncbi:MAG: site-2 protease family protein [Rhodospirillaceae bacterium]|nr:site-2 protease family protein [Rhodospirillaceae bacterium]